MKKDKFKIADKKPKQRNEYTPTHHAQALKYYLLGLNLHEISKLLNIPVRTLEKWQAAQLWTQKRTVTNIQKQALELKQAKKPIKEIAKLLNKSTVTIWRYIKHAETETETNTNMQ